MCPSTSLSRPKFQERLHSGAHKRGVMSVLRVTVGRIRVVLSSDAKTVLAAFLMLIVLVLFAGYGVAKLASPQTGNDVRIAGRQL